MSDIKGFSPLWEKWEIVGEIGSGLYGTVYKIKCEEKGETLYGAAKHIELLNPSGKDEIEEMFEGNSSAAEEESTSPMEERLNAFLDEIETNYSFARSKNLLIYEEHTVFEKSDKSGYDIFVRMPYYESLADILKSGGLSEKEKKQLGADICSALSDLERRGIFHGDIKPENIFRNEKGGFLLSDFGIAKRTDNIVNKKAVKQTVAFMAPELQENKGQKNTADIYSLGLLLYKLFNENREPFINESSTPEEKSEAILKRIKGVPFPAPSQADPELAKVILIACQFAPEARWKNASAFKSALLSAEKGVSGANAAATAAAAAGLANESTGKEEMTEEVHDEQLTAEDLAAFEEAPAHDAEETPEEEITQIYTDQVTKPFEIPEEKQNGQQLQDYDNFTDPEFEFAEDEPEKKGRGKIALIIIAIVIVLAALGGVIYYAISTGMFGFGNATADEALTTTEEVTQSPTKPSAQPQTTVPAATEKPTEAVQYVSVPDVIGMDYSSALDELSDAGLSVSIDSYVYSDDYAENSIIEISPSAGESAESGDTVSIVISRGPKPDENTTGPAEVSSNTSSKTTSNTSSASSTAEKKTGGYLLEGSDSRYIDKSEIVSMDERALTLALNEIYARHGRIFQTEYIAEYFNSKSWYEPKYTSTEYDSKVTHNGYEDKNISTIVSVMKEKGYR